MQTAKPSTGTLTRPMPRHPLADITPAPEPGAMDPPPDITSTSESQPKNPPQSWDSLCISQDCPIKHPHNFGLRPQTNTSPLIIWTDADARTIDDDRGYPDTQPPPLIKAMIDTLRIDPEITMMYPCFTDVLRDFYRAHEGRSHVYHGPEGMFGLGMDLRSEGVYGVFPYHRHPDEEELGGWFAFEVEGDEENEGNEENGDPVAAGYY